MVKGELLDGFRTRIKSDRNELFSDVSVELGGEDAGLDPHQLLEASLAACTLMTLKMYAKRKDMYVGELKVDVKIEKEGKDTEFVRTIHFDPHLTDDCRNKLLEIADKCPIHKVLHSNVSISTKARNL